MARTINLAKQTEGMSSLKELLATKGARVRDLGHGYETYLEYDMNSDSIEQAVFKIVIKGAGPRNSNVELILYKEQIMRILQAV